MSDKDLMEDILVSLKGVCDLYMHGTIESSTQDVHSTFDDALNTTLQMQNDVYTKMAQRGWYPEEVAPHQQIQKVKQQYSAQNQ